VWPGPIRSVTPRRTPIELWDSGVAVTAQGGETVQAVATKYAVPSWAVAQLNGLSEHAELRPGQRLVVPRHVDPISASMASPLTSFAPARH